MASEIDRMKIDDVFNIDIQRLKEGIQRVSGESTIYKQNVDDLRYNPPTDCENFSGLIRHLIAFLYGLNTIGQVYSYTGKHSFNIILTLDNGIYIYEPQRELKEGALWSAEENDSKGKRYKIDGQIIAI